MLSARTTWKVLRAGDLRARLRATRDGQAAIRLHMVGAALDLGLLDALADEAATTGELARRIGVGDEELLGAFLRALAAGGLVRVDGDRWLLAGAGRAVVEDDLVRASYEAFTRFHTGLYRELGPVLAGGARRRDVVEQGGVIARISAAFEPFVDDVLTRTVTERRPQRVLDIGCGAGLQLATMLAAAPAAEGLGVDTDADAVALAERTLRERGLEDRARIRHADVRELAAGSGGEAGELFDLALFANAVYYVPVEERVALLRDIAGLLAPGGALVVVTTAATPHPLSRHFDLLLRAQEGRMELPDVDQLARQLTEAGLRPDPPRRLAPAAPLVAVTATVPGRQ